MNIFANVLGDMVHLFKIILVCSCFFKFDIYEDKNRIIRFIIMSVIMTILSIFINLNSNELVNSVLYVAATVVFICCIYKERIIKKILSTIWIIVIMAMMDIMSKVLVDMMIIISKIQGDDYAQLVASSLSIIFVVCLGMVFQRKNSISLKNANISSIIIFTLVAIVDTVVIMTMANFVEIKYIDNILIVFVFCIVVLGTFFQLAVIIMLFVQRNLYQEEKKHTQNHLNEQKKYYEYLEMREKDTKKFRHDIINHMEMLSRLIESKEFSEADKYLSKINHRIEGFGNVITVNNGIVDAIINRYYSIAQEKSVDMKVLGMFPVDCDIDAYDLCTIFSNMLCNAVEAAAETEEKKITLNCRYTDDEIVILAENTFNNIGQFKDGLIKTTKFNKENHGLGLENIRECVSLNHGHMYIEIKGNKFVLKILLKRRVIDNENSNC